MQKIQSQDIFGNPAEAVLDYLASQYDDAGIRDLLRSGADQLRSLLQASLASAPAERQDALTALVEYIGKGIIPDGEDEVHNR